MDLRGKPSADATGAFHDPDSCVVSLARTRAGGFAAGHLTGFEGHFVHRHVVVDGADRGVVTP